jgi:hypothetical protein
MHPCYVKLGCWRFDAVVRCTRRIFFLVTAVCKRLNPLAFVGEAIRLRKLKAGAKLKRNEGRLFHFLQIGMRCMSKLV